MMAAGSQRSRLDSAISALSAEANHFYFSTWKARCRMDVIATVMHLDSTCVTSSALYVL
jgi:hypothetical protein